MRIPINPVRADAAARQNFGNRICRFTLLIALTLILGGSILGTGPATAAESFDYEWDPSGIYTSTLRRNAGRTPVFTEAPEFDEETHEPSARTRPKTRTKRASRKRNRKARTAKRKAKKSRRAKRSKRSKRSRTRVASLGRRPSVKLSKKSLSGGSGRIVWSASSRCLNRSLRNVIAAVAANYGRVRVNSTCRSKRHNRRVGGARRSYHLTGDAADIRIFGNWRRARSYLRSAVGGYKHYGGGRFHIDTGPRRRF